MHRPRVVITGIGAVTPIGNTLADFWEGVLAGRSGGAPIQRFDPAEFDTKFACEVKNFDPLQFISRKEIQRMDPFAQLAIASATMAIADSGMKLETLDHDRIGVTFGSGIGGMWTYHNQ